MCVMRARARTIVFCITDSSVSVSSCVTSLTPDCGSLRSSTDGPRGLGFDGAGGLPGGFCGAVAGGCFSAPRLAFSVVDMCVYIRCEFRMAVASRSNGAREGCVGRANALGFCCILAFSSKFDN